MVYCNISAILLAIIKLKYLNKKQILEIQIQKTTINKWLKQSGLGAYICIHHIIK
jgi:hypothetical protein